MLTLVTGGARSGKSRFAQSLCTGDDRLKPVPLLAPCVTYIATARVEDEEVRGRIERHRQDRPAHWITIEEPLDIAKAARGAAQHAGVILIDCLTMWLSNLMWERREQAIGEIETCAQAQIDAIAAVAADTDLIAVSNEVGAGIVPENEIARRFRDLQGFVNQRCAARADRVFLTVAGIAVPIKPGRW